ncbi:hypothetical protein ACFWZ2_08150 [Streptomyces sp. NPDC059002]|uniref:hypothetical protein n=1 Tax=Streptomyces sp. NPDC059002 TaxID=3346690 RepID=UPI0036752C6A
MGGVPWAYVISSAGGVATTLLGVVAGGLLGRRTQTRHWLTDTKATAYAAVLREYTRVEFGLRLAYFDRRPAEVDWAAWSEALTSLSLIAEDEVIMAANDLAQAIAVVGEHAHRGTQDSEQWQRLQTRLAEAQLAFVNAARRSLDRKQPPARARLGGPFIPEPGDSSSS